MPIQWRVFRDREGRLFVSVDNLKDLSNLMGAKQQETEYRPSGINTLDFVIQAAEYVDKNGAVQR
jgi:hypothetical protein